MSDKFVIKQDNTTLAEALKPIMDHAKETNAPVTFHVEDKGSFVIMTEDQYADLLDQNQSTSDLDLENEPLLAEIASLFDEIPSEKS